MGKRESFGSRLGFILVSAGCAVGLGNVWKFPYICGQNGGATFVLIYLVFLALLGFPILICEFSVGRGSEMGPARSYDILEEKGTRWHHLKWLSLIGSYLLMMFYTMVGGWMLYYVYKTVSGGFVGKDAAEIGDVFNSMLGNTGVMSFWMIVAVLLSLGVCAMGLQNGIEKISKVIMTMLIILILVLAVHSVLLPGAVSGIKYYLVPSMDGIRNRGAGPVIFDAMTHAFFTLSIGIGSMHIFGSYLRKDNTIVGESLNVVLLDTFIAIMAGFIIIPACFAYGIEPGAGPSLLFITLPNVFNQMSGGIVWGTFFFVFMSFAAISTIIAVFENLISFYIDNWNWSRKKAVLANVIIIPVLSMPAVLGFNLWAGFQPMGSGSTVMDVEDFLVSYNLLPLGSLMYVLFCTRKNGWGWERFTKEVNTGSGLKLPDVLRPYMTYVLPLVIVVIYLKGYYDMFADKGTAVLAGWMVFAVILLALVCTVAFARSKNKE